MTTLPKSAIPASLLVLARSISTFGSMASSLAVVIWMREVTGNNAAATGSIIVFTMPIFIYPLIGQRVDSLDRLTLLILGQLMGAGLTGCFLLVHGAAGLPLVYVLQFLQGVVGGVISISADSLLPQVADKSRFATINGFLQAGGQLGRLLGPGVGVVVFTRLGGIFPVVVLDVASFLIAVLLLLPLARFRQRQPRTATAGQATGYWAALREGITAIQTAPTVRMIVSVAGAGVGAACMMTSVWYAMITSGLHRSAAFAGVLATAQALGGILGGFVGSWFAKHENRIRAGCGVILVGITAAGGTFLSGSGPAAAVGALFLGLSGAVLVVLAATTIQVSAAPDTLGRVFASLDALVNFASIGCLAIGAIWLLAFGALFQPVIIAAILLLIPGAVAIARIKPLVPAAMRTSEAADTF